MKGYHAGKISTRRRGRAEWLPSHLITTGSGRQRQRGNAAQPRRIRAANDSDIWGHDTIRWQERHSGAPVWLLQSQQEADDETRRDVPRSRSPAAGKL